MAVRAEVTKATSKVVAEKKRTAGSGSARLLATGLKPSSTICRDSSTRKLTEKKKSDVL